jgi:ATP-binding cassette, subfamily B, bacterial HlyB/CyaB
VTLSVEQLRRFEPFQTAALDHLDHWLDGFQPLELQLGAAVPTQLDGSPCCIWLLDAVVRLVGPHPDATQAGRPITYGLLNGPDLIQASLLPDTGTYRLSVSTPGQIYRLPQDRFQRMVLESPQLSAWLQQRLELAQLGPVLANLPKSVLPEEGKSFRNWLARLNSAARLTTCRASQLFELQETEGLWFLLRALPGPNGAQPLPAGLPRRGLIERLGDEPQRTLQLVQLPHALLGGALPASQPSLTSPSPSSHSTGSLQTSAPLQDPWTHEKDQSPPLAALPLPPSGPSADGDAAVDAAEPHLDPALAEATDGFPVIRASGQVPEAVACFRMLAKTLGFPIKPDVLARLLEEQIQRTGGLSLQLCAALAEYFGLQTQLAEVPQELIERVTTPALLLNGDELAVLYAVRPGEVLIGAPREGLVTRSVAELMRLQPEEAQGLPVLLLRTLPSTPKSRFGLKWFIPAIQKNKKPLIEVLVASLFVQLFQLMNPLLIQQIIDKVIGQNGMNTLPVLAVLLIVFSIFENMLTALRTNLFVDTTNRIDLSLGEVIIDHLLKLPLGYFDRRPVGELSSRLGEMENIRSFLTGTALTVVLDSVFSVIYIAVMLLYSWILTLVALLVVPLLAAITIGMSPVVRAQLRTKAELNARTQSHLVEILSGIQTVKAQNFELKARWKWKENYGHFVSEGFRNAVTSTSANSLTNFLNQLSGLSVLCVGAWLVLQGQLTLGGLIAFRIIAGYVTGPLLRLVQLYQTFQQTALSMERLADIIDTPQESELVDRTNIPMPEIKGQIIYEDLSFRFGKEGPLQLANVSVLIEPGQFVGIVGQSGSGKSTLTKLLPRLYPPLSGRIFIDGFDIAKVELYSLRRQIGIVPQDSLLFEGTVQDNIALTNPEATSDEIIAAARIACAHDFIMQLPMGYNTPVGERGGTLSGGQRQRIALARTVLQNPRILILDEATSALDVDTERKVCLNLMEAMRGRTVLFITHRLNTIRSADRILLMHQGSLAEDGSHQELLAMRGRYYTLFRQQEAAGESS